MSHLLPFVSTFYEFFRLFVHDFVVDPPLRSPTGVVLSFSCLSSLFNPSLHHPLLPSSSTHSVVLMSPLFFIFNYLHIFSPCIVSRGKLLINKSNQSRFLCVFVCVCILCLVCLLAYITEKVSQFSFCILTFSWTHL